MSEERCETCRFWKVTSEDNVPGMLEPCLSQGWCHRYPPLYYPRAGVRSEQNPSVKPHELMCYQPLLCGSDWCGEYRPIGAKSDVERIEEAVNDLHSSLGAIESAIYKN